MSCWPSLTDENDPSPNELYLSFRAMVENGTRPPHVEEAILAGVEANLIYGIKSLHERYGKPVILAEVGCGSYDGTIIHWDGSSWSTVTSPTTAILESVYMISSTEGWAVGHDGTIIRTAPPPPVEGMDILPVAIAVAI